MEPGAGAPPALLRFPPAVATRLVESEADVVVTGAAGWMGRVTLELLESALGPTFTSRVHAFGSSARSIALRTGTRLQINPLSDLPDLKVGDHLVTHYAFATREFVAELGPAEYIRRNQELTELVADHLARRPAFGLLVPSSGAAHVPGDLAANPYAELKRRDERRFLDLSEESPTGTGACRVVVPRVFNLAGPFLNKPDRYALGSILTDIRHGGPIRLTAPHPVVRSYVHVGDLVALAFAILTGDGPRPVGPFDTAGEREVEVGELATLAASVLGHPGMPVERPEVDAGHPDRYVGDGTFMHRLLHQHGLNAVPLPEQIVDTARFMGR